MEQVVLELWENRGAHQGQQCSQRTCQVSLTFCFFSKNLLSLNILDTGVLISESFKPSLDCVLGIRRKSVNGPDVQTGGFKAG